MFDDKTITKQKVKDLIYALRNEFDNELDYDYESNYKTELIDVDYDIMNEYLNRFVDKLNLTINDELEDVKEDINMLCSIKLPVKDGYRSIIVEAPTEYTIEDIKEGLRKIITDEDIRDDIDFISEMTIENYEMKDFFVNNGFKIYNLKEVI